MSHVSENDATVGVEAAAKAVYEKGREAALQSLSGGTAPSRELPEWDDLHAVTKNEYRNHVLPIVWSFLGALPDNRHAIWLEGYVHADSGGSEDESPYYPSA